MHLVILIWTTKWIMTSDHQLNATSGTKLDHDKNRKPGNMSKKRGRSLVYFLVDPISIDLATQSCSVVALVFAFYSRTLVISCNSDVSLGGSTRHDWSSLMDTAVPAYIGVNEKTGQLRVCAWKDWVTGIEEERLNWYHSNEPRLVQMPAVELYSFRGRMICSILVTISWWQFSRTQYTARGLLFTWMHSKYLSACNSAPKQIIHTGIPIVYNI